MNVQAHAPQHETIQKHVEIYYFFNNADPQFDAKYYVFPNTLTQLSIHKNVETEIAPFVTRVFESFRPNNACIAQGMREMPLLINLNGRLDQIVIAFKPLGLNHFIKRPFASVCPQDSQIFNEWNELPAFRDFTTAFYGTSDQKQRISILEEFLLSVYQPLAEYDLLDQSIRLLTNFDEEHSIAAIAAEVGLNERTFNRLFKKNVGISPAGFKKVARFRHSINNKLYGMKCKRLTDLGYASNFYDQSYFTNMYRQMTGSNPKAFFKRIRRIHDDRVYFYFVENDVSENSKF